MHSRKVFHLRSFHSMHFARNCDFLLNLLRNIDRDNRELHILRDCISKYDILCYYRNIRRVHLAKTRFEDRRVVQRGLIIQPRSRFLVGTSTASPSAILGGVRLLLISSRALCTTLLGFLVAAQEMMALLAIRAQPPCAEHHLDNGVTVSPFATRT